ncbi:isocitrate/isopropylmalate dehydrogenase family protein [Methylobacterium nonmethylotrophicum]|uniref:3-isopropylmalate dehydrogenase n=1 Tax=Methylobacterium nonmethylotrophicum TaxID=1141884 RepID=A0A4Z0NTE7_9HYPH|nr:isocitrate/isopropylmalate family dehydrogenase [Methylobacterium nonmethylotrophicum]TGD99427.1 isocitrate/isopropylmalate dehydrogenase family protein [Methylobacterium nonmethylotrophicum]
MAGITTSLSVAVLPGDGIGREVMAACLALLAAAEAVSGGPALALTPHPAGAQYYLESGDALPAATVAACRNADAILFGAMGWPDVRFPDGTEIIPQLDLRMEFDLYAGVRPIRWFPGLPRILADERARGIDFVLVREQTEGLFYARGRGQVIEDRESCDTMRITRAGTARASAFAFGLAERRRARRGSARVTCIDKANVFTSMAFFRKVFDEVAAAYPEIAADHAYVDAMALTMVKKPWALDVMVTENMFGDILSDLAAGLVGGMGMAPSADIGDRHALFQPAHGTAPDIAGQGKANPCAMFLSAAMMLDWLAERHAAPELEVRARLIEAAIAVTLSSGTTPMEVGGDADCAAMTRATIAALPAAIRTIA